MTYLVRRVSYEPVDLPDSALMPLKEAAERLRMTIPGVIRAIERGTLTELVIENAPNPNRDRRRVLRDEVEALRESRFS